MFKFQTGSDYASLSILHCCIRLDPVGCSPLKPEDPIHAFIMIITKYAALIATSNLEFPEIGNQVTIKKLK